MPRYRDVPPATRVYTVCDESKFLIVRNVPALGCGYDLANLFSTYGEVEECKPMDGEDCEPFTDVYWIKFERIDNARYAKRKLDEFVFLGNRLQVSYAPQYESLSDTTDKLEWRRRQVLTRVNRDAPSQLMKPHETANKRDAFMTVVSSNKEYFASQSMNHTVELVRGKLNMIQSSAEQIEGGGASKKARVDNRRRI